jgi:hypothetical protein
MSAIAFDTVLHEALALPFDQRSFLATQLIASLEEDDTGISPAWTTEALKRSEELTNRSVTPLSLEAFKTHVESRVNG